MLALSNKPYRKAGLKENDRKCHSHSTGNGTWDQEMEEAFDSKAQRSDKVSMEAKDLLSSKKRLSRRLRRQVEKVERDLQDLTMFDPHPDPEYIDKVLKDSISGLVQPEEP